MGEERRTLDVRRFALSTMMLEKKEEVLDVTVEAREVRNLVSSEEWSSEGSVEPPDLAVRLQKRNAFRPSVSRPQMKQPVRKRTLKIPLPKNDQRAVRQVGPLSKLAKSDERMVLTFEGSVVKMMSRPSSLRL